MDRDPSHRRIPSYGHRRGRRLGPGRQALIDEVLPRLAIAPPPVGQVLDPAVLFEPRPRSVWLEIGFGAGEHLAFQAVCHPRTGFIGAEPYLDGIAGLLARARAAGVANIRLWTGDVRDLLPALAPASIGRAFVLFPDPWPKLRHHKRRLVTAPFLDELARVLKPGAELRLASDDRGYLVWMLERLTGHRDFAWAAAGPEDWRTRPEDWPPTRYELKAAKEGRTPVYLRFQRRARRP